MSLQILINGFALGSVYALIATGFSLIFNILKFSNFSHGALMTLSAFIGYFVSVRTGWSLVPIVLISMLAGGIIALIGEFVAPPAEKAAYQMRLKERGRMVGQDLRSGLWVKDEQSFINVPVVLPDTSLRGIRIYEFDEKAQLHSITEAAEGKHVVPDSWRLTHVVQTVLDGERAEVRQLPELLWRSALSPDILSVLMVSPDRMSLRHLSTYTKHLADNHQKTNRYDIAFWKKVIYPLAAFVMVALALPFGGAHYRAERVGLKIFSGVMVGILFYMLNGMFSNLGAINSWSPLLSAVTPSALFLFAAATMIWWVDKR